MEPKITLAAALVEANRRSCLAQLHIQFGQSVFQHLAMVGILNGRKLLRDQLT
jgi:hypothetical protein